MSRPSEIANSLLHRYYNQKQKSLLPTSGTPRPKRIQTVTSIQACERFRSFIIRDISQKITRINDPSVDISQIRGLNDEINKLHNEKLAWEYHIKQLGGPNHVIQSKRQLSKELNIRNYRYFGRAKELDDVKEFMLKQKQESLKKTKINTDKNLLKYLDSNISDLDLFEYYGGAETLDTTSKKFAKHYPEKLAKIFHKKEFKGKVESTLSFDEFNPPSQKEIEGQLLVKRKNELKLKLGI